MLVYQRVSWGMVEAPVSTLLLQAARVCREGGFVRHGRVAGQLSVSRSLGDHHLKARVCFAVDVYYKNILYIDIHIFLHT